MSACVDGSGLVGDAFDLHAYATRPDKGGRDDIPVEIENPHPADHPERVAVVGQAHAERLVAGVELDPVVEVLPGD